MSPTIRIGARVVRALARAASWLYPRSFRRMHARDFTEVADHWYERESTRRAAMGATLATSRLIVADTVEATPAMWMTSLAADPADGSLPRHLWRRTTLFLGGSRHDFALAVRTAIRRPLFSLVVVATLGLGIGASTATFDALDRVLLHPLPFAGGDELVLLVMQETKQKFMTSVPLATLTEWRARSTTLRHVEIFRRTTAVRLGTSSADALEAIAVSGGLPSMLGLRPVAGRVITPADAAPGAPAVVMLGEGCWRRDYGADPAIIGRPITIGGKPSEVIGIWPANARLDFFDPPAVIRVLPAGNEYSRGSWVQVLARMRPGVSTAEAERELRAIPVAPDARAGTLHYEALAIPPADLLLGGPFVTGVWLVFAGGLLLLAAAVANTAHLLLERAAGRSQELGVRAALGGSRARLARLFLCEGVVYAIGGLTLGAATALGLERLVVHYEPRLFREAAGAGVAGRALLFAAAVSGLTTVISAVAPLLRNSREDIGAAMGRGHRLTSPRSRVMTALVGLQAAFGVLLVFGALLMTHSLVELQAVDPGIDAARLAEFSVSLPAARYPSPESRELFATRAIDAIRAIPGVTGAVTSGMPLLNGSLTSGVPRLDGEPDADVPPDANTVVAAVPSNYLDVMGMRVVTGRMFGATDSNVAIVNEWFARRHGNNVVGRQLFLPRETTGLLIVGVVNNVRYGGLANDVDRAPAVYTPAGRWRDSFVRIIARTTGDPQEVISAAHVRIADIDPTLPLLAPQTGRDVIRGQAAQHRFVAVLLIGLAGFGFLLAMSGVYGAVALSVVRRRREIGVRLALGADTRRLVRGVVAKGLVPVAAGSLPGAIAVWLAAPYAKDLLFRISAHDPASGAVGLGIVMATSTLAALVPARRILRIDPSETLRQS